MAVKTYPNKKAILKTVKAKLGNIKSDLVKNIKNGELPVSCFVLKALNMTTGIIDDIVEE
jgi:hypothetical protein